MTAQKERARYIMIGGFLGAGKTTSIQAFARYISDCKKQKVGLITNDQGGGLVDSAIGRSHQFPVEEISGGCFCCRFDSLVEAAQHLVDIPLQAAPDVFLAEPVGSCTDLVATVSVPLQQVYGESYVVAPLSVLVDPTRALRVLGLDDQGRKFSANVVYIYRKQLQEADHIVINKVDSVSPDQLQVLKNALEIEFPEARLFEVSAREGTGLEEWFECLLTEEMDSRRYLDIDYAKYGDGEALLGWLNATLRIEAGDDEIDGNGLLKELAGLLRENLAGREVTIAHLKMTLTPIGDPYEIAAINLVRDDAEPELSHHLLEPIEDGELLLNIRAECDASDLKRACESAFDEILRDRFGVHFEVTHSEAFQPGKPVPTHRVSAAAPLVAHEDKNPEI
ncbi:MAG: GTP-binding protein [Akkermansiaceae bacterium]|jgi:G3E family GTPase